ncbi:hypothetical protein BESB_076910 [Besnoitia besnoiti]|uniref:Uncharacterized protein n=1 Tax=Besnoitia besnoiti TaxID=94643 RepID=A0A2A9M8I1_BESBE|nr:hypothetical protein BESB_076910 [Besnoitia besnoiti]PFH33474.1 hypothetical protein BESB_076910 [Besnoitia besnoiti]
MAGAACDAGVALFRARLLVSALSALSSLPSASALLASSSSFARMSPSSLRSCSFSSQGSARVSRRPSSPCLPAPSLSSAAGGAASSAASSCLQSTSSPCLPSVSASFSSSLPVSLLAASSSPLSLSLFFFSAQKASRPLAPVLLSRGISFKNRAEWRAFMRLPPKSRVEPRRSIPRIYPWRMAHNPLPRRYPLYKHRTLFLPLSLPSYAPQPAISGVPVAPLTVTSNAADLPHSFLLQKAVRELQPLAVRGSSSSVTSSSSSASLSPSSPLELPHVLRDGSVRSRRGAAAPPSCVAARAAALRRDAVEVASQFSSAAAAPHPPPPLRASGATYSGAFVVLYSADEFASFAAVRAFLDARAPGVRLEGRQEAGAGLFKILRRDDSLPVFVKDETNRPDKTRRTALARRETGTAAVRNILLACGAAGDPSAV